VVRLTRGRCKVRIPMRSGYLYMCAVIDPYSRYKVGWGISNTKEFAVERDQLIEALRSWAYPGAVD
jgi:putative transposase